MSDQPTICLPEVAEPVRGPLLLPSTATTTRDPGASVGPRKSRGRGTSMCALCATSDPRDRARAGRGAASASCASSRAGRDGAPRRDGHHCRRRLAAARPGVPRWPMTWRRAVEEGVDRFTAEVLTDNSGVRRLIEHMGEVDHAEGGRYLHAAVQHRQVRRPDARRRDRSPGSTLRGRWRLPGRSPRCGDGVRGRSRRGAPRVQVLAGYHPVSGTLYPSAKKTKATAAQAKAQKDAQARRPSPRTPPRNRPPRPTWR
jgi:hypothetical protein